MFKVTNDIKGTIQFFKVSEFKKNIISGDNAQDYQEIDFFHENISRKIEECLEFYENNDF
jgi:hypothetical protein